MNTVGFKGESVTFKLLNAEPQKKYIEPNTLSDAPFDAERSLFRLGNEIDYVGVSGVERDFSQGSSIKTGNSLDIMIEGEGFLAVNTKNGIRYTRNGSLSISADGVLVNKQGGTLYLVKKAIFF